MKAWRRAIRISRSPRRPLSRVASRASALTFGILILDILLTVTAKIGWISAGAFSVLVVPPAEEALKAGLALLLGIFFLSRLPAGEYVEFSLAKVFALAGAVSGAVFALTESLAQGEPLGALLTGLYVHPVLTTGVGIACWSLILANERFLATTFPLAVAGHASWNYFVLHPSPATRAVTIAILITTITLTTWKYLDLRSGSPMRLYSSSWETA